MTSGVLDDETAVTPVVGVGIAVAIVLLLAAVVTMVVLGADEATDEGGPDMQFEFSYNDSADPTQEDSFSNTGATHDGLLTITFEEGDVATAEQLLVDGAASEDGRVAFSDRATGYGPEDNVEAGDTVTVWVDSDDSVTIVWQHLEEEQSDTVDGWNGPDR